MDIQEKMINIFGLILTVITNRVVCMIFEKKKTSVRAKELCKSSLSDQSVTIFSLNCTFKHDVSTQDRILK